MGISAEYMNLLQWTDKPPTKRGWYWVITNPEWRNKPEIVLVSFPQYDDRFLFVYDFGEMLLLEDYCNKYPRLWLGPIPEPEMPKG